jgi:hypothetical protein
MAGQDAGGRGGIEDVLLRFDCFQERRQRMAGDDAAVGDLRLVQTRRPAA